MKNNNYFEAVGRRKTATARVRLKEGSGKIEVLGSKIEPSDRSRAPLALIGKPNSWDIIVRISGGGKSAQHDAIALGISRALIQYNPEYRPALKKAGFLTRDPREKERKKPGLKGARKAPQWAKR